MNADVERFSLLVAFVNGSAAPEERRTAEAMIARDPAAADECRALHALRDTMRIVQGDTPQMFGLERLQRDITRLLRQRARIRCLRMVTAVAASLFVAVGAVTFVPGARDTALYRAMGGASRAQIQLRFAANATQAQIQSCLREVGAEIVSGPSAVGMYRVRLPSGADLALAIATLRSHSDIVEFAEREP